MYFQCPPPHGIGEVFTSARMQRVLEEAGREGITPSESVVEDVEWRGASMIILFVLISVGIGVSLNLIHNRIL